MLTLAPRRQRSGLTLVELTVALTIGGLVLAVIVGIAVRQQRIFGDIADETALEGRLREAASVLPIGIRSIAPSLGDLRVARDTALEVRATIASAIVCDTSGSRIILAPSVTSAPGERNASLYSSYSAPIVAGDTAWLLSVTDTSDGWTPHAIVGVGTAEAGECAPAAPRLDASASTTSRIAVTVATGPESAAWIGLPLRVTRPMRYSLYRASDGAWYLGERDWSYSTARFNTIQPVAGPFLSASDSGLRFSFLDSTGILLAVPIADLSAPRAVRLDVRGETGGAVRALGSHAMSTRRIESVSAAAALRGGGCC